MTIPVAAFDFDGTLTNRDSLVPFLCYRYGLLKTYLKLMLLTPSFLSFLFGLLSRQQVKERILTRFFQGTSIQSLKESARGYALTELDKFIKSDMLQILRWHQQQGHRCIIVSASIDIYLIPWAEKEGIKDVISSTLELTPEGIVIGRLAGKNCWGAEKTRRLIELLGPKTNFYLYAYGDSEGDRELLAMADVAHKI
jgi:phosphatidylglycerophosphatase C